VKTLRSLGEFGWIAEARKLCGPKIGDDAAVLPGEDMDLLVTTDMILEGRHFVLKGRTPSTALGASAFEIGWKAMAVNLSDIAAMAGVPKTAVISLGAPADAKEKFLVQVYKGMLAAAKKFGVEIVGGDTNSNDQWVLAVTLFGTVEKGKAVRRRGAKPGDWVFVTGALGGSYRSKKHLRFTPRVKEARWLAKNFCLHSMMDLSDGLASDIRRIADESEVGAILNESAVPVSKHAETNAQALTQGEDFELLFTLSPDEAAKLMRKKKPSGFPPFTHVGWIVPGRKIEWLKKSGRLAPLKARGFEHYR
jgi:thiamine-monophosphate kinase